MKLRTNILIVGGTGFIGYHLAKFALKKGWDVTSISTKPAKKLRYIPRVKYIFCDISKKNILKKKIKKSFEYVVNLGGHVDHSHKIKTLKSHYIGCKNLTDIFLKKPPKSFVQIGSSVEYGRLKAPQKENSKCKPKSVYGRAKLLSSEHLMNLFRKKNFPSTILRLYLAYGPRQDINRFLPIIINGCIKNKKFPCSAGNQLRDFVYIDDVVEAIIKSLVNKNARGQIINIGSGKPKQIKKIIEYIKKFLKGGRPQFGEIKFRKDEILKLYANISKAKNKINWKPKVTFSKGIKSTIKFYNEQAV